MSSFFFFCLLALSCNNVISSTLPQKLLTNERFEDRMLSGEERLFFFDSLEPLSQYEVRISYPATNPASFSLKLVCFTADGETKTSLGKNLLNTEKIMFQTYEKGEVPTQERIPLPPSFSKIGEGCLYGVRVVGKREGKATDPHGHTWTSPLTYHIVLEKLFHPMLPVPNNVFIIFAIFPFFFVFVFTMFRKFSAWTSEPHID